MSTSGAAADSALVKLIRLARTGDAHALGSLLDQFRGLLRAIAEQQLDSQLQARLDASDLVQQTCLSVHRQIGRFEGEDPAQFIAWLKVVHERNIQNAIRDQRLAQKRAADREVLLSDQPLANPEDATASVRAIQNEERLRLLAILEQLPPDERTAIRLRYLEGKPLVEVAAALDLTKDGLIWLMKRAMKNLRQHLEGGCP